jgi:hypothetical protein
VFQFLVTPNVVPSSLTLSVLMTEVIRSSKTSGLTTATWCHIPEDCILHSHCHENLRSYIGLFTFYNTTRWRKSINPEILRNDMYQNVLFCKVSQNYWICNIKTVQSTARIDILVRKRGEQWRDVIVVSILFLRRMGEWMNCSYLNLSNSQLCTLLLMKWMHWNTS